MTSAFKRIFRRLTVKLCSSVHTSVQRNNDQPRLKSCLLTPKCCEPPKNPRKVSIIGAAGNVGIAIVLAVWHTNICEEIVLFDINTKKINGEVLDLLHGEAIYQCPNVKVANDVEDTCDSDVLILPMGVTTTKAGQSRLDLLETNVKLYQNMVPKLACVNRKAVFIVVSNPVDLMTYFTWKFSQFDPNRIIGSGCELDTSRFQHSIAKRFNQNPKNIQAYIIGEHGDSSVPVWSTAAISGTRLRDFQPNVGLSCDTDNWNACHKEVIQGGYTVHHLKNYTNWAIGLTVMNLAKAILTNARTIHCCSVHCKGMYGIESDTFLSVPCVLGTNGCESLLNMQLDEAEKCALLKSENILKEIMISVKQ